MFLFVFFSYVSFSFLVLNLGIKSRFRCLSILLYCHHVPFHPTPFFICDGSCFIQVIIMNSTEDISLLTFPLGFSTASFQSFPLFLSPSEFYQGNTVFCSPVCFPHWLPICCSSVLTATHLLNPTHFQTEGAVESLAPYSFWWADS